MTDFLDDTDTAEQEAFEMLGRRAGAELRGSSPEPDLDDVERAVRRRATTRMIAGTVGVMVLLAVAWVVTRGPLGRDGEPVDQTPVPTVPLPVGEPGTWRLLTAPDEPPDIVSSAAWTGDQIVVLGVRGATQAVPTAHVYDIRRNAWRAVTPPPIEATLPALTAWTGSELLAVSNPSSIVSLDIRTGEWQRRAAPPAGVRWSDSGALIAVSADGVLTRSETGWQWYDATTDTWTAVASPDARLDDAPTDPIAPPTTYLDTLSSGTFVLAGTGSDRLVISTFDPAKLRWTSPIEVKGPTVTRSGPTCQAADRDVVCWAEGFGTLDGVVVDLARRTTKDFTLKHGASALLTRGTPWFGHAWSLLLARTATWEALPALDGAEGFGTAIWDGEELIMLGGTTSTGGAAKLFAVAYTPVVRP